MGLQHTLDGIAERLARTASPRARRTLRDCLRDLAEDGVVERAVAVGEALPAFLLPDSSGLIRRMAEFLTRGRLVVSFFRGGWCPFCRAELAALAEVHRDLDARGAALVAISPQTPVHGDRLRVELGLDYPLLSDVGNAYAREVGLVFALPEALGDVYRKEYGIDLRCHNGDARDELPLPATYVVDRCGRVLARGIDVDHARRMEPAAILAALERWPGSDPGPP